MISPRKNAGIDGLWLRVAPPVRVAGLMATLILISSVTFADSTLGSTGTSAYPSGSISTKVNETVTAAVDTATGNLYLTFSDLIVPGKGLRFRFIRSYNNQDSYSGPLCRGWTHSYNILLTVGGSGAVTIKRGDGREDVFQPGGTAGSYIPPPGVHDVLAATGVNTYTLTQPDQTVLSFGPVPLNPSIIRLLSITDKNGNTQVLSYDSAGNLISFTDIGGGVFQFTYDASNHLTSVHDAALNRTLSYSCDVTNTNLITYADAAGSVSHYTYNSANLLAGMTDPRNNTAISNSFDASGRVVQSTYAPTCTSSYSYDDVNHITTITDPYGSVTKHYYDSSKRLIKILSALGFQTTFTYDAQNNLTSKTNPLGQTTSYTYDSRGNRTSVTDPLGDATTFVYDSRNNLTSQTDANGNSTNFLYDAHGNLIAVHDALGGTTSYTYDARGNRVSFTNARGKTTSYTYDSGNHLLATTDPLSNTTIFNYDAGGRLIKQVEPAGNSKSLSYDISTRLVSVAYTRGSLGSNAGPVTYTYDTNGNRLTMADSTGSTSYTYDIRNRVTAIIFPDGRAVSYSYNCNDNRTSLTYAGITVNFTYDAINRLTSVSDGTAVTTYAYDAADDVLNVGYANGASVAYAYDAAGRIVQVRNTYIGSNSPSPSSISSFTYVLDNVGNRVQVTDGTGKVSKYTYDKLYRLTNAAVGGKTTSYTYDAVGNRLTLNAQSASIAYSYDDANRLISAGSIPFTFDDNGNQATEGSGTAQVTFSFDSADRLTSASGGGFVSSGFGYDGDGNRVSQMVGTNTYRYLNDISTGFATVLQEAGPDGAIVYVRGRGLVSAEGPSFTYYYHYDALGSVAGLTDPTGHLAQRYVYDVWGLRALSAPGPQVGTRNKFGYKGEALDPGTSLYYLRARYYDPTLGRFISQDPLSGFDREPQSLNRFVYVRNNPATLTDRTGLCSAADDFSDCETTWRCNLFD